MERCLGGLPGYKIREHAHKVIETASRNALSINYEAVEGVLKLRLDDFQKGAQHHDVAIPDRISGEREVAMSLFFNVVNFCYKNPFTQNEYAYEGHDGKIIKRSSGLMAAMSNADIAWNNLSEVANISPANWSKIIQLERNKDFYLGENRGKRISDFAFKMFNSGFRDVFSFIVSSEFDTDRLLSALNESGYFNDEFQKRSQLTVSDIDSVLQKRFGKRLEGVDGLTVMADYRLPQVMYNFGAIKLTETLKQKLVNQVPIESDSCEEVSLRAASIVIGERLSKLMGISESRVDHLLWTLAHEMAEKGEIEIPHMLVATDKY